jgi:amino acid adenylation domain-containing protein
MSEHSKPITNLPIAVRRTHDIDSSAAKVEFKDEALEETIPGRFEQYVRRYPDWIAFKTRRKTLSWDALNRAANRVARTVLGTFQNRERPIALLVDQESSIVAGMGVLKTGGFYVPLAPSHPRARNNYIFTETEAALILTDRNHLVLATELAQTNYQIINIDELDPGLSTENLGLPISPDAFAYIAYTSGSTGEPKGVVNTHCRVIHGIGHDKRFKLGPADRFTNVGSSESNAFYALLSGAGSFPWYVKEEGLAHLADWLVQEEITVYRSGPRVFREFVSTLTGKEEFPKLRAINLAGEPMRRDDVELYKKHFSSDCLLINTLGIREVGPFRVYVIGKDTEIIGEIVPVGYAMPDKEVLLLDNDGQKVGFNQVGEIAVRSRYLSMGYWRRPDLTKAKFLPDPESGDRRIYLTGDLGRMSLDGCLRHLGRKDFQIKIRGLRVDVSEVEKALANHPGVKEAIVTSRQDPSGDAQLVAYFVPSSHLAPTVSGLRNFLQGKLPDYMIPSAFIKLDAIPLTSTGSGKVDRRALPDPGKERPDLDTPYVAPRTPVEEEVAKIWTKILALNLVGIHDNFLELGGHSLAATRVVSHVLKTFQVEIPLRSLFEAPTVAEMAAVIVESQARKLKHADLDRLLTELESLSDNAAQRLLDNQSEAEHTKS